MTFSISEMEDQEDNESSTSSISTKTKNRLNDDSPETEEDGNISKGEENDEEDEDDNDDEEEGDVKSFGIDDDDERSTLQKKPPLSARVRAWLFDRLMITEPYWGYRNHMLLTYLGLNVSDIRKLWRIYKKFDLEILERKPEKMEKFCDKMGLANYKFVHRVFSFMNKGQQHIPFIAFAFGIWNFVTLRPKHAYMYAFDIYDLDGGGTLDMKEIKSLFTELYEEDYDYVESQVGNLDQHIAKANKMSRYPKLTDITKESFMKMLENIPEFFEPIEELQTTLQKYTLGIKFWRRMHEARYRGKDKLDENGKEYPGVQSTFSINANPEWCQIRALIYNTQLSNSDVYEFYKENTKDPYWWKHALRYGVYDINEPQTLNEEYMSSQQKQNNDLKTILRKILGNGPKTTDDLRLEKAEQKRKLHMMTNVSLQKKGQSTAGNLENKRLFIESKKERVHAIQEIVKLTMYQHHAANHMASLNLNDNSLRKTTRHISRAKSIQLRKKHMELIDKWKVDYLPTVSSTENEASTLQIKSNDLDDGSL